jgi:hypothetical protein
MKAASASWQSWTEECVVFTSAGQSNFTGGRHERVQRAINCLRIGQYCLEQHQTVLPYSLRVAAASYNGYSQTTSSTQHVQIAGAKKRPNGIRLVDEIDRPDTICRSR